MKSVLMIAYAFPPWGSAGVYRPLRFVRHLSKMDWSPTVLSADPYAYERYDPDLLRFVPDDTEIIRVRWVASNTGLESTTDTGKAFGSLWRNSRRDPCGTFQVVSFDD